MGFCVLAGRPNLVVEAQTCSAFFLLDAQSVRRIFQHSLSVRRLNKFSDLLTNLIERRPFGEFSSFPFHGGWLRCSCCQLNIHFEVSLRSAPRPSMALKLREITEKKLRFCQTIASLPYDRAASVALSLRARE